jgi:putative lipoic acid-binding regulatory protein
MSKKSDSFYNNLETKLNETHDWPTDYVFKFIVENKDEKISQIELEFKKLRPKISKKISSKKTYVSLTIIVKLSSANQVIKKYKDVSKIDGIISL